MRLPRSAHTDRPWRIHAIAGDFRIEDVWSYRMPGAGPDDFPAVLAALRAAGGPAHAPLPVRFLFAVRWRLGALFGWDADREGLGGRVPPVRDRLPADIPPAPDYPDRDIPLVPVYELADEAALEMANRTCQGIAHLGWVRTDDGYELRMAVLVKPNSRFGRLYMAAIAPFRHLVVYPYLTRQWERAWRDRATRGPQLAA